MKTKKPSLKFHPFVKRWVEKSSLNIHKVDDFIGYVAKPEISGYPENFKFELINPLEDLKKINKIYGTCFDEEFLYAKVKGNLSLEQIAKDLKQVRKGISIFPTIGKKANSLVYIGGIGLPKRDFLYVETSKLDMSLNDGYVLNGLKPQILRGFGVIPIAKKYFKNK